MSTMPAKPPLAPGTAVPARVARQFVAPRRAWVAPIALHVALALGALAMTLPFVWMVLASLKPFAEVGSPTWLPSRPAWGNYAEVFRAVPFGLFLLNSVLVAAWVTLLQVLSSALAAFAFARLQWPGRDRVFLLYLATIMLPGLVMTIPNYQLMIGLRLVDTLSGLIVPSAFGAFGVFLLRQFMLSIPRAIDEAATIDGAGPLRLFWDIMLPLCRPGLVTLAIFTFLGNYQSFFWPLVMLRRVENYTLPVGLLYFDGARYQSTHLLMAAATMSVVPMVVLFVALQRQLVAGISVGAVKG